MYTLWQDTHTQISQNVALVSIVARGKISNAKTT